MDSDDDGFTDAVEIAAGSDPVDDESVAITYPDFSDAVDAEIGSASGLDSIEGNLTLWLDAANIDGQSNAGLNNGDAISKWTDLSGNGNHAVQDNEGDRPSYNSNTQGITGGNSLYMDLETLWGDESTQINSLQTLRHFAVGKNAVTSSSGWKGFLTFNNEGFCRDTS